MLLISLFTFGIIFSIKDDKDDTLENKRYNNIFKIILIFLVSLNIISSFMKLFYKNSIHLEIIISYLILAISWEYIRRNNKKNIYYKVFLGLFFLNGMYYIYQSKYNTKNYHLRNKGLIDYRNKDDRV